MGDTWATAPNADLRPFQNSARSSSSSAIRARQPSVPKTIGDFAGAFTVAVLMSIVFTFGFSTEPNAVGKTIAHIGESRTLGYKEHGGAGMLTLFVRGMLCNWMVSSGVVGAMISTHVSGKVIAMWMPIMLFFFSFNFPAGLVLYWLVNNVLSIAQQWQITRMMEREAAGNRKN